MTWMFVDDFLSEARSFADELGRGVDSLIVEVVPPAEARERLLSGTTTPRGVLMDVDLSNATGERGSGPGLAQDIRVKQKAGDIREFPIVRFSGRAPLEKNVKGDPGSDDLFDVKLAKEEVARDPIGVQRRLIGLERVYDGVAQANVGSDGVLTDLLGLEGAELLRWSHEGFHDRLLSAMQSANHVAAGAFMRGFLTPTGLLIGKEVLSYRLGVDSRASGASWDALQGSLPFRYGGIAATYYERWWARGLEDWWFETIGCDQALIGMTVEERVAVLNARFDGLVALAMPTGSAGTRPWRLCALSLESEPMQFIPVDPSEAVRLTPRADAPIWTDPNQVALSVALQERDDLRLNRQDIDRLRRKHHVK